MIDKISKDIKGLYYCVPIVFCFLIRDDKILLIRAKEPYKGEATMPGGRKRRGESCPGLRRRICHSI